MSFDLFAESCSLDARLRAAIAAAGYQTPTPIQERAIPSVLEGRDVLGLAQTGTGKTAAFALPLLQRLLNDGARRAQGTQGSHGAHGSHGPRVLVLAPTRELAVQIHDTFKALGHGTGLRSAAVFGGVGQNPQVQALRRADIVVACPGRLLDLMEQRLADLSRIQALVLDEADRMFDMGFMPALRRVIAALPAVRQNLLFSATMPSDIRHLADGLLRNPVTVQVDNTRPAETVGHCLYPVSGGRKFELLEALLREEAHQAVLVFTRTKHRAKTLARKLEGLGWGAASLQGNLSQNKRQEALSGFRDGRFRILVATDIAARGIDCACISHVINFDVPDTAETYTHRIGRTGRAERTGLAITLVTEEDTAMVRAIERVLGSRIERRTLPGFEASASGEAACHLNHADASAAAARPERHPQPRRPEQRSSRPGQPGRPGQKTAGKPAGQSHRIDTSRPGESRRRDDRPASRDIR